MQTQATKHAHEDHFWALAVPLRTALTDPEWETTPATAREVEALSAEQEYLEFDAHLNANPRSASEDALDYLSDLYAAWRALLAPEENQA